MAFASTASSSNRFDASITMASGSLYLRLKDTKRELRTFMLDIGPPPGDPDQELTAGAAHAAMAAARDLSEISVHSHDQDVMLALGKALGTGRKAGRQ